MKKSVVFMLCIFLYFQYAISGQAATNEISVVQEVATFRDDMLSRELRAIHHNYYHTFPGQSRFQPYGFPEIQTEDTDKYYNVLSINLADFYAIVELEFGIRSNIIAENGKYQVYDIQPNPTIAFNNLDLYYFIMKYSSTEITALFIYLQPIGLAEAAQVDYSENAKYYVLENSLTVESYESTVLDKEFTDRHGQVWPATDHHEITVTRNFTVRLFIQGDIQESKVTVDDLIDDYYGTETVLAGFDPTYIYIILGIGGLVVFILIRRRKR